VALFPFVFMLRVAFSSARDYLSGIKVLSAPLTFENFTEVYSSTELGRYLFNSLLYSILTTLIVLVIGSMAGFGLSKARNALVRDNVMFFVLSTRMGPPVVFAVPLFLLMTNLLLVDTRVGMILVYTFYNLAFAIWLMYGFFREVPPEIEEAGLLDGLSPLSVFRRISLPLVVPGLMATGILRARAHAGRREDLPCNGPTVLRCVPRGVGADARCVHDGDYPTAGLRTPDKEISGTRALAGLGEIACACTSCRSGIAGSTRGAC
jgi:ABC-type glycerol-3-phosphate transport system permease component